MKEAIETRETASEQDFSITKGTPLVKTLEDSEVITSSGNEEKWREILAF